MGAGHPFPLEDKIEAVSLHSHSMPALRLHLPCCRVTASAVLWHRHAMTIPAAYDHFLLEILNKSSVLIRLSDYLVGFLQDSICLRAGGR